MIYTNSNKRFHTVATKFAVQLFCRLCSTNRGMMLKLCSIDVRWQNFCRRNFFTTGIVVANKDQPTPAVVRHELINLGPPGEPDDEDIRDMKRRSLISYTLDRCKNQSKLLEVPFIVGSEKIYTNDAQKTCFPHEHRKCLAQVYCGNRKQIGFAIKSALVAQTEWSKMPAEERLAIWRRAADIIEMNPTKIAASIVLAMGKILSEADEDVKRLISCLRMNADYLEHLASMRFDIQGEVSVFPSFHLRPMDGFVAALSPFESIATAANIALCPAIMGNTVLWNPSLQCAPTSYLVYRAMRKAGLPTGVVNFVPSNHHLFIDTVTDAVHFGGFNFQGDIEIYRYIFQQVATKLKHYICLPRIVGECQGKNFHFVHRSAHAETVAKATVSAAFNYAGQYNSSCSRLYVPSSMWTDMRVALEIEANNIKMGDPSLPETDMGAVIDSVAFDRMKTLISRAKRVEKLELVCGGECDDEIGYFVKPTIVVVYDPLDPLLSEPILGPFLPVFVYSDDSFPAALKLAANQSKYALSGSIFASKDDVIKSSLTALRMSASNLYVNERCTGNPQGLTPFGGNRLSGTNDKTGSAYFLMRWCSPLLIEESVHNPLKICEKCHCTNCYTSVCRCKNS